MVAANYTMAGNDDADAIGAYDLSHCPHTLCIADLGGYLHIAPCLSVWDVEQCLPDQLLEICSEGMEQNIKLRAAACKILVKLHLCLFNNRGRLYSEIPIHISPNPAYVSLGARHSVPITQAKFIANGCQDEFPAWRIVVLYANHLSGI